MAEPSPPSPSPDVTPSPVEFVSAIGTAALERRPRSRTLQAFDAADAFLLREFADLAVPQGSTVLVVNDSFGALATSIAMAGHHSVVSWSDSATARASLVENLERNGLTTDAVAFVPGDEPPPADAAAVLVRVPRSMALFAFQLRRLRPTVAAATPVVAGAMVKHLSPNARDLVAAELGRAEGSLTERRARCIRSPDRGDHTSVEQAAHADTGFALTAAMSAGYRLAGLDPGIDAAIGGLPGVFGGDRLDHGSELLIANLPIVADGERVVDLGCGTGVIGIACAAARPGARLEFVDESYLAVASTRINWQRAHGERHATFAVSDVLDATAVDHIVCNPPFHQESVVGDDVAWQMFQHAKRALRSGGTLTVVGNRHLGHHAKLKRIFGNSETVASSPKYVVLRSVR